MVGGLQRRDVARTGAHGADPELRPAGRSRSRRCGARQPRNHAVQSVPDARREREHLHQSRVPQRTDASAESADTLAESYLRGRHAQLTLVRAGHLGTIAPRYRGCSRQSAGRGRKPQGRGHHVGERGGRSLLQPARFGLSTGDLPAHPGYSPGIAGSHHETAGRRCRHSIGPAPVRATRVHRGGDHPDPAARNRADRESDQPPAWEEPRRGLARTEPDRAGHAARRARRFAFRSVGAPPGHSRGRAKPDRSQCPDRRREGRLFSANQPDRIPGWPGHPIIEFVQRAQRHLEFHAAGDAAHLHGRAHQVEREAAGSIARRCADPI